MRRIRDGEADGNGGDFARHRGELYTGEITEALDDGQVVGLITYAHGVEDGPRRAWYADGTPRIEGRYRNGSVVGVWREWHPNGVLAEEAFYSAESRKLTTRRWNEGGELVEAVSGG